ncbi:MAG: DUF4093 domain-containing protein [Clostridiales bacterium]|nr:DUF4093 domain-containing protein [Clostridiales bacterium]
MVRINEVIVVEGRYDKNTLSQVVDATIIETNGFGIFKDRERLHLLRRLAEVRGLIVLTDSDGAGFQIRNHIKSAVDPKYVKHAYIPDIYGKEKRKSSPSKEGKLGVEGMRPELILKALEKAGASFSEAGESSKHGGITKVNFYDLGLSGRAQSHSKRLALQKKLGLPERLSADGLLEAVNLLMSRESFFESVKELFPEE